jgi:hypothetical protein
MCTIYSGLGAGWPLYSVQIPAWVLYPDSRQKDAKNKTIKEYYGDNIREKRKLGGYSFRTG